MKIRRAAALAPIAALLPFSGAVLAQAENNPSTATHDNDDLRREVEEQKQRLAVLERKLELQEEAAKTAAAAAPRVTASASRFQIASSDGENFVRFRGTLRDFLGRARPTVGDRRILRYVFAQVGKWQRRVLGELRRGEAGRGR